MLGKTLTDKLADTASVSFSVDSEEANVYVDDNHIDNISQLNDLLQDVMGKEMSTEGVST